MATAKKAKPATKSVKVKLPPAPKPAAKASPLPTGLKAKPGDPLSALVDKVVKTYESQAEAARQMGIGKTYLSRLQSGIKDNPSDDTLSRLGIQRQVRYIFASA